MLLLLTEQSRNTIAEQINAIAEKVVAEIPNHGHEEGVTSALGHALRQARINVEGVKVSFNYRQMNRQTEEPYAGNDGGFLVDMKGPGSTKKRLRSFKQS